MTAASDVPVGPSPLYYHRTKLRVRQGHNVSVMCRGLGGGTTYGVIDTITSGKPDEWQITYQPQKDEPSLIVTVRQTDHIRYYGSLS